MPITSRSFVRSTVVLLLVGLAAILAVVATSLWLTQRTDEYSQAVTDVRRVRAAAVDLRGLLQEAETGQRGFLLTGRQDYLAPYAAAREKIPEQIDLLEERARIFPDAEAQTRRLVEVIGLKLDELAQTIDLARAGRAEDALSVVRSDRGKVLMDEVRTIFDALVERADTRFVENVSAQQASVKALRNVTLLGAAIIILVAGGAVWLVVRYMRELGEARGAIQELNAGLEERILERTTDLRRANEEIQRFAYIVTHDLRAPLVNIMGFTSELEASLASIQGFMKDVEETPESSEAKLAVSEDVPEALGFIRSSTRKMDALINAILKLSREGRRPLKPERIRLEGILRASADAVQHQLAEAEGEIAFDINAPAIVSDRLTLEQAFGNLLDNAVKYREPTRPLRLSIRAAPMSGGRVSIEFADNGRGIAESDHERVFELFRRSGRQDREGEGIGLAHVRSGIRNLGGDISVSSELGVGTTFRIVLPRDLEAVIKSHAA